MAHRDRGHRRHPRDVRGAGAGLGGAGQRGGRRDDPRACRSRSRRDCSIPPTTAESLTNLADLLRPARRAREADARRRHGAGSRRVVERRRATASSTSSSCGSHVRFHNGDPFTAEDVEVLVRALPRRVVEAAPREGGRRGDRGAHRVRFRLREAWPDFMTYLGTPVTGAGWVVPKAYVERVGDDGFRKAPVGAGPYRFVLVHARRGAGARGARGVLAQAAGRQAPGAASVPDESTRLAMLKRGRRRRRVQPARRRWPRSFSERRSHGRRGPSCRRCSGWTSRAAQWQSGLAVARRARASRRRSGDRPSGDQPG